MTSGSRTASGNRSDSGFSTGGSYVTGGEEFTRDTNYIEDRITRNAEPGGSQTPHTASVSVTSLHGRKRAGRRAGPTAWPTRHGWRRPRWAGKDRWCLLLSRLVHL